MSDVTVAVYRAPMRSRRDDVDDGSFVWTHDPDSLYRIDHITGHYF